MRALRLSVIGLAFAVLTGCAALEHGGSVAAVGDGIEVPRSQLEEAVHELAGDLTGVDPTLRAVRVGELQRRVLSLQIQAAVFEALADERGITITDADEQAVRDELLEAFGSEEALEQIVLENQLTMTLFDELILPQEARIDALQDEVGPEQLNDLLFDTMVAAEVWIAPGLGSWDPENLAVVEVPRAGTGRQPLGLG